MATRNERGPARELVGPDPLLLHLSSFSRASTADTLTVDVIVIRNERAPTVRLGRERPEALRTFGASSGRSRAASRAAAIGGLNPRWPCHGALARYNAAAPINDHNAAYSTAGYTQE